MGEGGWVILDLAIRRRQLGLASPVSVEQVLEEVVAHVLLLRLLHHDKPPLLLLLGEGLVLGLRMWGGVAVGDSGRRWELRAIHV